MTRRWRHCAGWLWEHSRGLTAAFLGLFIVSVNFIADDAFGGLIQILIERLTQLQVFRPQSVIEKGLRHTHHHGSVPLPLIAVRVEAIATTQRGKETTLPAIRQGELHFGGAFCFRERSQRRLDAFDGGGGGVAFAGSGCPLKQRGDLAELLAQLLFGSQRFTAQARPSGWRPASIFPVICRVFRSITVT